MAIFSVIFGFWIALIAPLSVIALPVVKRNPYTFVLENPYGDAIFELGNVSYLANTKHPKTTVTANCESKLSFLPITVIKTNETTISKATLESIISSYIEADDVFSYDFLEGLYVSSSVKSSLDSSAIEYLTSFNTTSIFVDSSIATPGYISVVSLDSAADIPAGPYLAALGDQSVSFATVYRLYQDTYRTFLFGAYDSNDSEDNHSPLGTFLPKMWDPMIP